jgi:hypothetical protein
MQAARVASPASACRRHGLRDGVETAGGRTMANVFAFCGIVLWFVWMGTNRIDRGIERVRSWLRRGTEA